MNMEFPCQTSTNRATPAGMSEYVWGMMGRLCPPPSLPGSEVCRSNLSLLDFHTHATVRNQTSLCHRWHPRSLLFILARSWGWNRRWGRGDHYCAMSCDTWIMPEIKNKKSKCALLLFALACRRGPCTMSRRSVTLQLGGCFISFAAACPPIASLLRNTIRNTVITCWGVRSTL